MIELMWASSVIIWLQIPALILSLRSGSILGMQTTGNNDVASYAMTANEFMKSGFKNSYHLLNFDLNSYAHEYSYQTPNLLISFIAGLFHLPVYKSMTIALMLALGLSYLSICAVIETIDPRSDRKYGRLISFSILLLPIITYSIGHYFFAQIFALSISFSSIALFLNIRLNKQIDKQDMYFFISLLSLSTLTYPHFLLPFIFFIGFITIFYSMIFEKFDIRLIRKRLVVSVIFGIISSSLVLANIWKFIYETFGLIENGWSLPKLSPQAVFLNRFWIGRDIKNNAFIFSWILFILITVFIFRMSSIEKTTKKLTSYFLYIFAIIILGAISLRDVPIENYTNWKLISYIAPFIALFILINILNISKYGKPAIVVLCFLLSINPIIDWWIPIKFNQGAVTSDMAMLEDNLNISKFSKLNLDVNPSFETMALASIINNTKISMVSGNYYGSQRDQTACSIVRLDNRKYGAFIQINQTYGITASLDGSCGTYKTPNLLEVKVPSKIEFNIGGNGNAALFSGWSSPESWGIWSEGKNARLKFEFSKNVKKDVNLQIHGFPFASPIFSQDIILDINGRKYLQKNSRDLSNSNMIEVTIPISLIEKSSYKMELSFSFSKPTSPLSLKMSTDPRLLGYGLAWINFY